MFKKIISYFLSLLMVFEPLAAHKMTYEAIKLALPYGVSAAMLHAALQSPKAFAAIDGVAEAQATGNSALANLKANPPTIDSGRSTITMPSAGGVTATRASTTPQRGEVLTDVAPTKATFGDNTAYDGVVGNVVGRVATEASTQGDAYRTIKGTMKRRNDYSTAPFLNPSQTSLNQNYTGCITTETVNPQSSTPLVLNEQKTCTRIAAPTMTACNVERRYTILGGNPGSIVNGNASVIDNSTLKTTWPLTARTATGVYKESKTVTVNWAKVSDVSVTSMYCDDDCSLWARDAGSGGSFFLLSGTSTNASNAATCGERASNIYVAPPAIDVKSQLDGIQNLELELRTCVFDAGRSTAEITWTVNDPPTYVDAGFAETPTGCWDEQFSNEFCIADSWTCSDSATRMVGTDPITLTTVKDGGGSAIWASSGYEHPTFESTNVCWKADASGLCNFGSDTIPCFEDVHGNTVCPDTSGGNQDLCSTLETEGCEFVSEECAGDATDSNGKCWVYTGLYKCAGQSLQTPGNTTTTTTTTCAGTRCMGAECANEGNESNNDFGLLSGLLGQVDSMAQDGDCDENGCVLFKGKDIRCQTALGGLFDCCDKTIPGVTWVDYLKLAHGSYKIAQAQGIVGELPSVSGIATKAANGVVQAAGDLIGNSFMSSFDIASAGSSLIPASATALMNSMVSQAYSWVATTFSPQVAANFFTVGGNGAITLGAAEGSLMASLSTVFVYIYVAYLILSIVFACTESDMELAASKQMRACRYIGTYCAKKFLGACYAKKQTYCCYGSALSRIMQEQIRAQILGWGGAKNPQCGGITPAQLEGVNWSNVDLSEYAAMMTAAEIKPAAGREAEFYGMDNLTKVNIGGDNYSPARGNGSSGINAVDAIAKQTGSTETTGLSMDTIRQSAVNGATAGLPGP